MRATPPDSTTKREPESFAAVSKSIPGVTAQVARHAEIVLAFTGLDGVRRTERLTGADAICAQHEYDHLDGLVHFDRLDPEARAALMAEYDALP